MTQQPRSQDPLAQARAAYEQGEKQASKTLEELVASQGFAESLAMITSNIAALSRMGTIGLDQLVRMSRLAGRSDIARIGRQLARTEDKLEHVLQVVEQLESELAVTKAERDAAREALEDGGAAVESSTRGRAAGRAGTRGAARANGRGKARSARTATVGQVEEKAEGKQPGGEGSA